MAQPYIGEIRMFAGTYPPAGWLFCNGEILPISENETLFMLIGTTYGGDGESTFALPNLQSRVPMHMGNGPGGVTYPLAQMDGVESVTLTTQQIPSHNHGLLATSSPAAAREPVPGNSPAVPSGDLYNSVMDAIPLNAQAVTPAGGSQPHENCQPFLCINYIISLFGLFPQPT